MNLRKKIQETKEEKAKQEPTNMKQELANIWNIENIAKLIEPFDTEDRAKIFNHILNNKKILARVIYDSRNIAQLKKIFPQKYHEKIYASILHQNILSKLTYDANAIEQLKKVIPQKYHETIYFKLFDTLQKNYHAQKQKEPDSSAATSLLFSSGEKILCAYPRHQKDIYEWASQHIRFNQLSNSEKQKITLVFPEETEINQAWFIEKREQEWEMLKDELKNAIAKKKMDDEEKKYIPTERANQDQNRIDLIAPKAALATQFDPNKQDRYAEFWLKNLPLLIEEFKKVREFHLKKRNSSRGIAEKLYALVA
ncbi:MAG TPA: hypothetical protein VJL60_00140, partial [Gammaproteobacteria bacterium]|nr:hypothetical protein [Gammaproteobacteria bacterium]